MSLCGLVLVSSRGVIFVAMYSSCNVLCVWFVHSGGLSVDPMFDVLCFVCFCCCLVLVLFLLLFCVFCVCEIGMSLLWLSW